MPDDDMPDYLDEDGVCEWDECGAHGDGTDVQQWQRCMLAGTEHCDFECRFAAGVRALLARQRDDARERRRDHTPDLFTPNKD